jgi:hypothetical protein
VLRNDLERVKFETRALYKSESSNTARKIAIIKGTVVWTFVVHG